MSELNFFESVDVEKDEDALLKNFFESYLPEEAEEAGDFGKLVELVIVLKELEGERRHDRK